MITDEAYIRFDSIRKRTIQEIDLLSSHINPILSTNSKTYSSGNFRSIQYLLEYIKRSIDNLDAISCILINIGNDKAFENPLGIILRSGLLDFITLLYNDLKAGEVDDNYYKAEFEDIAKNILFDHFNYLSLDEDLKITFKEFINISDKGKVKSGFGEAPKFINMKQTITNQKNNYFYYACEHWEWYSKYEHFGFFSYDMQRLDREGIRNRMFLSISHLIFGINVAIKILSEITDEFSISEKQVGNIRSVWESYLEFLFKEKVVIE